MQEGADLKGLFVGGAPSSAATPCLARNELASEVNDF